MADHSSSTGLARFGDLKKRLLFLVGALIVFRIGSYIPVPGVDPHAIANLFSTKGSGILGMLNTFSGGAMERFSLFAIGIMPYISASIVMQLAAEILPSLKALKKEGEAGRRKITKYTRLGTVILASVQAIGAAVVIINADKQSPGLLTISAVEFYFSTVVCLVTGTMFLMWLGEQITERGIGNGISMLICTGIASGIPGGVGKLFELTSEGAIAIPLAVVIILLALALTFVVVFIESGQRKIPIQYAKRQIGNKIMQGQSTHMPFKINMSGVIPAIFASSILMFPTALMQMFSESSSPWFSWLKNVLVYFQPGMPLYTLLFAVAIIFFCYFYTALTFNPRETADNLKKSGAFVPGIRPGEQTSRYVEKVILHLTFFGAIYMTAICILPLVISASYSSIPFYLGGTSLLIMVVVTMDFRTQIASFMMQHQYESLMKKSSFKNSSALRK